jgi:hypothetical protein
MGESIGEVIGYFIPDLLLVVFSEGISELIEGALKAVRVVLKGSEIGKLALEAVRVADVAVEALAKFVEKADIFLDTKYAELKEELLKIIELIKEWLGIEKEGTEAARMKKGPGAPKQPHEEIDHWADGRKNHPGDGREPVHEGKPETDKHLLEKERKLQEFKAHSFNQKAEKHIFEGEINPNNGKAGGVHHINAVKNGTAIIDESSIVEGTNGTFKAKIKVKNADGVWIAKTTNGGFSTFFPNTWSKEKVIEEIMDAFENRKLVPGTQSEFAGFTAEEMEIRMYINSDGQITSAFPHWIAKVN